MVQFSTDGPRIGCRLELRKYAGPPHGKQPYDEPTARRQTAGRNMQRLFYSCKGPGGGTGCGKHHPRFFNRLLENGWRRFALAAPFRHLQKLWAQGGIAVVSAKEDLSELNSHSSL